MKPVLTPAERLYAKIPELKPGLGHTAIHLSKYQIKRLDDDEFSFLFYMPGMIINVHQSTQNYVEKRRRQLRLVKPDELPPLMMPEDSQKI